MVVERRDSHIKSFFKSPLRTVRGESTWSPMRHGDTVRAADADRILIYGKSKTGEDVVTRAMLFEDGSWASISRGQVNEEINNHAFNSGKLRWRPDS